MDVILETKFGAKHYEMFMELYAQNGNLNDFVRIFKETRISGFDPLAFDNAIFSRLELTMNLSSDLCFNCTLEEIEAQANIAKKNFFINLVNYLKQYLNSRTITTASDFLYCLRKTYKSAANTAKHNPQISSIEIVERSGLPPEEE